MVNLDSRGDLAIAELAFYCPAFLIAAVICFKQGFSRNLGWFYMVLISVLRIIGASVTLYMETQQDYSSGLIETAAITSAVGTAPLLLALNGFLQRINRNMDSKGLSPKVWRPIELVALVALIVAIVGGVDRSQSNGNNYQTGKDCSEAGAILFLIVWIALAGLTLLTGSRMAHIPKTETKMMYASICVLPFLLVRVIYTVASAFANKGSVFYFAAPDVLVQAFMMFLMEAITLSVYIIAGLLTPKQVVVSNEFSTRDVEMKGDSTQRAQQPTYVDHTSPPQQTFRNAPPRGQRSLGDYRPSRLIRDAIRGR